jgi:hypothetical protein
MCSCDGDGPSVMWDSRPKAKKRHRCSECRGWIEPGEVYWRVRGVWDGEPSTFAMCSDCDALLSWAGDGADCFCWSFGQTHSDVLDFMYDSGDAALIAEADARVTAIRKKRRDPVAA